MVKAAHTPRYALLELARVLLVDDDPASRLTIQTVLQAGGYRVETAASAAEAVRKMEEDEYELILSELGLESPQAGHKVLAHARMMSYRPAAALIRTYRSDGAAARKSLRPVLIEPDDVPGLLTRVAELISERASRRLHRQMRAAANS